MIIFTVWCCTCYAATKVIYALSDTASVHDANYGNGGTWAGTFEQLTYLRHVPVVIGGDGEFSKGLQVLAHGKTIQDSHDKANSQYLRLFYRTGSQRLYDLAVRFVFRDA